MVGVIEIDIRRVDAHPAAPERVAVELSADAARALVKSILAALASGEAAHAA